MSANPSAPDRRPHEPAAVLWDMDGTLIDSEPLWLAAEEDMLTRFGIGLTPELTDRLVGTGLRTAARHFQNLGVEMSVEEIIEEWRVGVIRGLHAEGPVWRPGALELLESLRAAGIPMAIVTMSTRAIADEVVSLLPEGLFQAVIAGDEVEHEKPHPEPYVRGAERLGVSPEQCVALEDSPTGLASARAAGTVALGIPCLVDLDESAAHELLPTLSGVDADTISERFVRIRANEQHEQHEQHETKGGQ